jgi:hypothetical protein
VSALDPLNSSGYPGISSVTVGGGAGAGARGDNVQVRSLREELARKDTLVNSLRQQVQFNFRPPSNSLSHSRLAAESN